MLHRDCWIAPTATLIGDVTIEAGASIWFGVVIRSDFGSVVVQSGANVQDNSVIHGGTTRIEEGSTIGHGCVVHGAVIGREALIGNGAVVLDGARVGPRTLVAAGSIVAPKTDLPGGVLAVGTPARVKGPLIGPLKEWVERNQQTYRDLARRYAESLTDDHVG